MDIHLLVKESAEPDNYRDRFGVAKIGECSQMSDGRNKKFWGAGFGIS